MCPSISAPFYASLREENEPLLDRLLQGLISEQPALQGSTNGSLPLPHRVPGRLSFSFKPLSSIRALTAVARRRWLSLFAQIPQTSATWGSPVLFLNCRSFIITKHLLAFSSILLFLSTLHA